MHGFTKMVLCFSRRNAYGCEVVLCVARLYLLLRARVVNVRRGVIVFARGRLRRIKKCSKTCVQVLLGVICALMCKIIVGLLCVLL